MSTSTELTAEQKLEQDKQDDFWFRTFTAHALQGLLASGKWDVKQSEDDYVKHALSLAAKTMQELVDID